MAKFVFISKLYEKENIHYYEIGSHSNSENIIMAIDPNNKIIALIAVYSHKNNLLKKIVIHSDQKIGTIEGLTQYEFTEAVKALCWLCGKMNFLKIFQFMHNSLFMESKDYCSARAGSWR